MFPKYFFIIILYKKKPKKHVVFFFIQPKYILTIKKFILLSPLSIYKSLKETINKTYLIRIKENRERGREIR